MHDLSTIDAPDNAPHPPTRHRPTGAGRLVRGWHDARGWARSLAADERGDVPGWVLVTLMTAGLVVLIWAVAGPALTSLFEQAIQRVSGL